MNKPKQPNDPDLIPKAFEPLGNLVILQLVPVTKSPGGIQLPDTVQGLEDIGDTLECRRAWVVAHGCQCRYVRRGDLVLPNGAVGMFMHNGKRLAAINEDKLIGIERAADGEIPKFRVADWKEQIIHREGEPIPGQAIFNGLCEIDADELRERIEAAEGR